MKEVLFPIRTRCKICRKAFPSTGPLLGVFCSPKCAGREKPAVKIEDAPRACKTDRGSNGSDWHWKRKYDAESQVSKSILNDPSSTVYWCEEKRGCLKLHIGHSRVDLKTETTRVVSDSTAIADVLVKARDSRGWTRKEAADRAKIRPIRLKELEEGSNDSSWDALFAISKIYGIKWAAVFR